MFGKKAPHRGAQGRGKAHPQGEDPHGKPLSFRGIGGVEDGLGRAHDEGLPEPLKGTEDNHFNKGMGRSAGRTRQGKDCHTQDENLGKPVSPGEGGDEKEPHRRGHHVGGNHPLHPVKIGG